MEHPPDPRVAEALARLATLDERPVEEHPAVYDDVHRLLQHALAGLDSGGPPPAGPPPAGPPPAGPPPAGTAEPARS